MDLVPLLITSVVTAVTTLVPVLISNRRQIEEMRVKSREDRARQAATLDERMDARMEGHIDRLTNEVNALTQAVRERDVELAEVRMLMIELRAALVEAIAVIRLHDTDAADRLQSRINPRKRA